MQVKLKGLFKVRRKLVSGEYRVHYYAWRGGPKMRTEYGTPEFVAEFNLHHQLKAGKFTQSTTGFMIDRYLESPEGTKGAKSTVKERARYCQHFSERFGTLPLIAFESPAIRTRLYAWRDEMADKPRTADERWRQFSRVLKWGKKRGYIQTNPMTEYESLYEANRAHLIWTPDEIKRLIDNTTPEFGRLCRGAIHLGARVSDLRALKWSDIKENETIYRPSKGKRYKRVAKIPHTPFFRALIAEIKQEQDKRSIRSIFVFTNTRGAQWSQSAFKSADRRAREAIGREDLHFHDLRGTAATIKASGGNTAMQIAGMLGWSMNEVETMLNRYVSWNEIAQDWSWAVG